MTSPALSSGSGSDELVETAASHTPAETASNGFIFRLFFVFFFAIVAAVTYKICQIICYTIVETQ